VLTSNKCSDGGMAECLIKRQTNDAGLNPRG
jgi:hypothetical protein